MKHTIIGLALFATCGLATAQSITSGITVDSQTRSASNAANDGMGNGNNLYQIGSDGHKRTKVATTPDAIAPSNAVPFSVYNCAGTESAAVSALFVGASGGKMTESDFCNGRANVMMMAQVAATFRAIGTPDSLMLAERIERALRNLMCQQDDKVYAVMSDAGLCDTIDFQAYKEQRARPVNPSDRWARARTARASFDNLYPQTGN